MNKSRNDPILLPDDHIISMGLRAAPTSSWIVPGRKVHVISSFLAHHMLALGLAFGTLALGVLIVILAAPRTYRAEAMLRVTPTYVASLSQNSEVRFDTNVEYHDYVEQQIYEIESYATAVNALDLLGTKRGLFQEATESNRRAAERLMKLINVRAIPDSYLVSVSLEGPNPQGTAAVVNSVARAYLARHREQDSTLNRERFQQLTDRKSQLEEKVKDRSGQLDEIARLLGTSSFDSEVGNHYEKMRAEAATQLSRAKAALIKAQSQFAALKAGRARSPALDLNSAAEQAGDQTAVTNDRQTPASNGGPNDATAELRKEREAAFLQLRGLASNHPGRKALEAKIADIEAEMQRLHGNDFNSLIDASETSVEEAQREEQGLEAQLAGLDKQAASFASKYNEGLLLQAAIRRDEKEIQDIDGRLNLVQTEAHTPGIVQLDAPARIPDLPEKGTRRKIALVISLLALVLCAGVPTFVDLTDSRIRTVAELEEIIGIPALGVAQLAGESERPSRDLLRRMALAILRERRNSGNRVFVLTSVAKGGGTTSLALALERELTLFGANAVTLEANPLSPDPRYQHLRISDGGFTSPGSNGAVRKFGERATTTQLHTNGVAHNSISHIVAARPYGEIEIVPELMQRLLDEQLATHDIVLLDAAPLLESADTEMLIQMPAATILIVQAERDRLERVKAATDAIARISPPVVGAVLLHRSSTYTTLAPAPEPVAARVESRENVAQLRPATEAFASRRS